ncbi:39S ribosomal protein L21, mitochondrial [Chelonus insularis]|uniref:39S ribosomal protein L21, mitochondrial n=1 Tax=Chelonus insularis TaxID=460826 RepID=UPI00158CBBBF|nr:39S ribosomal protein L21, mitochondrial [Chelonus insularis]
MMVFQRLPQILNPVSCLCKQVSPLGNKLLQNVNSINLISKQGKKTRVAWLVERPKTPIEIKKPENRTSVPWLGERPSFPAKIPEPTEEDGRKEMSIYNEINNQLLTQTHSRLFAIIYVAGKQFKVTDNDLIVIEGYWPPNPGDEIKFEKVLLVGGTDFTLIGRPLINSEMANVSATVIEKTFSHTKYMFYQRPRKQYRRLRFLRVQHNLVRINSINLYAPIHEKKQFEGLDRIY